MRGDIALRNERGASINMAEPEKRVYLLRANEIAEQEATFSHPWNSNSQISGTRLSPIVGLKRVGVSFAKIPPGKESFIYHSHHREEEWIYIISGRAIAEIDGEEFDVGAGDFMGFPTPSVAHHLRNPYDEHLVYLMGGENLNVEIADFPRLGKRMLRLGEEVEIYDMSEAKSFDSRQ
ncbi:cupin domain-containing protein [Lusitaniella coriacea LEGE 07167]